MQDLTKIKRFSLDYLFYLFLYNMPKAHFKHTQVLITYVEKEIYWLTNKFYKHRQSMYDYELQ